MGLKIIGFLVSASLYSINSTSFRSNFDAHFIKLSISCSSSDSISSMFNSFLRESLTLAISSINFKPLSSPGYYISRSLSFLAYINILQDFHNGSFPQFHFWYLNPFELSNHLYVSKGIYIMKEGEMFLSSSKLVAPSLMSL